MREREAGVDHAGCAHGDAPSAALTRRRFLSGVAGAAAGLVVAAPSRGQLLTPAAEIGIIDVHHHISPPALLDTMARLKQGERPRTGWTPARSIEEMGRAGVAASIVSIASPAGWNTDRAAASRLAHECNIYAATLATDHRGRFGVFATLPLPAIDESLKEITFALDVLKADGVGVLTSYGARYLGDPLFTPVMEELNRRKAIVYVHPSSPNCCRDLLPDVHYSVVEFATDTTRAITNLIFTGTTTRFPDVRFIFSHAGGTMPYIYQRLTTFPAADKAMGIGLKTAEKVPNGVLKELQSLFYDTAQSAHPMAMLPLSKLVSVQQILFGSDFPYRTQTETIRGLSGCEFRDPELAAIYRNNTLRLMPQLGRRA